jgi:hypothetical protein
MPGLTSTDAKEHLERIQKNLNILKTSPEVYNKCQSLLGQGEVTFIQGSRNLNFFK